MIPTTGVFDTGRKTLAIQTWIRSVLRKIVHYKAEHRRYLNEAAATLQSTLPLPNDDIVFKNVIPFLELPSYTFEGEDQEGGISRLLGDTCGMDEEERSKK